jgi:hypothetical protein
VTEDTEDKTLYIEVEAFDSGTADSLHDLIKDKKIMLKEYELAYDAPWHDPNSFSRRLMEMKCSFIIMGE